MCLRFVPIVNSHVSKRELCLGNDYALFVLGVNELLQQYVYGGNVSMATSLSEKEGRLLTALLVLFDIPHTAQLKLSRHCK